MAKFDNTKIYSKNKKGEESLITESFNEKNIIETNSDNIDINLAK